MLPLRIRNRGVFVLTWTTLTLGSVVSGQLIRPLHIYKNIIRNIHDYFNNTCIVLMHATPNPVSTQDLEEGEGLLALQKYLSSSLHIRTTVMDIETFRKRVGLNYYHIKRPLFVLLNDSEDVRTEFTNVSTWISMAYPTWLAFFRDDTSPQKFFVNVYVPFDCVFIISRRRGNGEILTEVYQIDRGKELRSMTFGTWNQTKGFKGPTVGLYQRRDNLYGQQIRVTTIEDPPITSLLRDKNGQITGIGGSFGGLLSLLQEKMNCTFIYNEAEKWSDVINALKNNDADIAVNELMMTADRMDVIDFTTPVFTTKCRTFIKTPSSTAVKWKAYMAPFHAGIWHSIGFLIVVTSVSISLIKATIRIILSCLKDYENSPSRFTEVVFCVFGAFCNQGIPMSLLDPVRVVHLVIHLTAVVVLAAYSAALISFLAVKNFVMPFTTMEGLLKDGTYRFATVGDSADYHSFQNTSDKVMKVLFRTLLMKEEHLPMNYLDGLKLLCREKNYAFMMMDNTAAVMQDKVDCTFEPLDSITQTSIAMAVRPGCPYRDIINSNILLVRDSGVLQRLLKAEWSYEKKSKSTWGSVEINDVLPPLLFMYGGLIVSLIILFWEKLIFQKFARRRELRKKLWKKQLKRRVVDFVS